MTARVPPLLALLVLAVLCGPLAAVGSPVPAIVGPGAADQTLDTPTPEHPEQETIIEIGLRADGDARWTVTTRVRADTEAERDAFRQIASEYENGERPAPWLDAIRAAAGEASSETGRSMEIVDVQRSSSVENGTLTLALTWTDFARQDGDRVVVDDAFNTSSGTWLDGLTEDQVLVIELPKGYGVLSAPIGATLREGRVSWEGPEQFDPGYLRIVYSGDAARQSTTTGSSPTTTTDPTDDDGLLWGGFFALGVGIVVVGAYVLSQRRGGFPAPTPGDGGDPDGDPPDGPTAGSVDETPRSASAGTVEPGPAPADEALLSDEERVERLLEANGGRMKQASIVKETGWSNAKVSQLLSAMEADGQIDKLRIGRENLISFPDEDIADFDRD